MIVAGRKVGTGRKVAWDERRGVLNVGLGLIGWMVLCGYLE